MAVPGSILPLGSPRAPAPPWLFWPSSSWGGQVGGISLCVGASLGGAAAKMQPLVPLFTSSCVRMQDSRFHRGLGLLLLPSGSVATTL